MHTFKYLPMQFNLAACMSLRVSATMLDSPLDKLTAEGLEALQFSKLKNQMN